MQRLNMFLAVAGILVLATLVGRADGPQSTDSTAEATAPDNVIEEFNIAKNGDLILLPVVIADHEYKFMVDTGSTWTIFDESLRFHLGAIKSTVRLNKRDILPVYSIPNASVGKSQLPVSGPALCIDLSGMRQASGHDLRGILGMSFLKSHVVRIDFDAGDFSFLKSARQPREREVALLYTKNQSPCVKAEISDTRIALFKIDTGDEGNGTVGDLEPRLFESLREQESLIAVDGMEGIARNIHGDRPVQCAVLNRLRVGDCEQKRLLIADGKRNLLGLGFLSRYLVTFDFPNASLYLEPGKRIEEPARFDQSGLGVMRVDDEIRIIGVKADSPAAVAGIQAGDRVVQINRTAANQWSLFEFRRLLCENGRNLTILVLRGDEQLEFELALVK